MNKKQRIILIAGGVGVLHSSMVPPVAQTVAETCRYHEFAERSLFFTRTYAVNNGDQVALFSEYGIILAVMAIAYLVAGAFEKSY